MFMSWLMWVVILVLVGGIAYLAWTPHSKPKSRDEFLFELVKYLGGQQEDIEGSDLGIRIKFSYEGHEFAYEEIQTVGFRDRVFKGFLKANCGVDYTFYLAEKKAQKIVRPGYDDEPASRYKTTALPQSLHVFNGFSNNAEFAKEFLKDAKIEQLLNTYKSVDMNGYPFMSLRIKQGEIVLEFNSVGRVRPSLIELKGNVPSIEQHIDKIYTIIKKIKEIQEAQRTKLR